MAIFLPKTHNNQQVHIKALGTTSHKGSEIKTSESINMAGEQISSENLGSSAVTKGDNIKIYIWALCRDLKELYEVLVMLVNLIGEYFLHLYR